MDSVSTLFDVLFALAGLLCLGVGLVVVYAIWFVTRRSIRAMPDDAPIAELWRRHGIIATPNAAPSLRAAAARIDEGSVDSGHEALGLPAPYGVRLAGRVEDATPWWVGDVWNVNSVSKSGGQTQAAAVQIRAVAAMPLPRPAPHVMVGRENAFTLLVDAAGLGDVRLEGEAFNRAFRIKAKSPRDAYAVLTPEVMEALEASGGRFALEIQGRLLTLTEVSGVDGNPAEGQLGALDDLVAMMRKVVAGTRPHTWPEGIRDSPDEWRGDSIVVDPRPPGAPHPQPRSRGIGTDVAATIVALVFVTVGAVMTVTNLLDLVSPG